MLPDRPAGPGRPRSLALSALHAGGFALAAALLALSGCAEPRVKVDCDQMLNKEQYDDVIKHCENPYQRASAYLGKAGFDTFKLIASTAPDGKVAGLLGLTAANVNEKRLLINKAIAEVKNPKGGNQAFALLLASFLGLAVTTEQFLDNGAGGTALDDILVQSEVDAAVSITGTAPALSVLSSATHFSVMLNGASYVIDCALAASPCGSNATAAVYDDPDGSGRLVAGPQSASKAAVLAGIGSVTSGGFVVQLADLNISVGFSVLSREPATSYLGRGGPGGTFDIGMSGYMTTLDLATAELQRAAGSTGGSDITTAVDAITTQLDNGAPCAAANPIVGPIVTPLNEYNAIYAPAGGTLDRAATGSYAGLNLVPAASIPDFLGLFPAFGFPAIPGSLAFTVTRYKVLYPTQSGLAAFDLTNATPRVDQSFAAFQTRFEDIWLFAPAASPVSDGKINLVEVLCSFD